MGIDNIPEGPNAGDELISAAYLRSLRENIIGILQEFAIDPGRRGHPYDGTVPVKNNSGGTVGFGGVLKLASLLDPYTTAASATAFDRGVYLVGTTPAAADDGQVGIAAQPMGDGIVGRCYVHGECPARVDILDADHQFAIPKASTAELQSAPVGSIQILWKPATTGVQRCIVRLGVRLIEAATFAVLLDEDGGSDGTGTTAASYTYTATSLGGSITYGTELTPERARPNGKTTSGDGLKGIGYYDHTGTFKLFDANEKPTTGQCPTE